MKNNLLSLLLLFFTIETTPQNPSGNDTFYIYNIQTSTPYIINQSEWWECWKNKKMLDDYEQLYDTLTNYEEQMKRIEDKFKKKTTEKDKIVPR